MKKLLLAVAALCCSLTHCLAQAGTLDSTFGVNGIVTTVMDSSLTCAKVITLPGNAILAAGVSRPGSRNYFAVIKYHSDGTIDNTFGTAGKAMAVDTVSTACYNAALQPDGKIVLCGDYYGGLSVGYLFYLARFTANGIVDSTFGTNGFVATQVVAGYSDNYGYNVAIAPDGKIIVGGTTSAGGTSDFIALRYKANGVLDSTFGTNGMTITPMGAAADNGYAMTLQPDGKIVQVGDLYTGTKWQLAVLRLDTGGTADNTFGTGGKILMPVDTNDVYGYSVMMQGQKIIVGAYSITYNNILLRFNPDGTLDNSFGTTGMATANMSSGDHKNALATLSDGQIVLANRSSLNSSFAFSKFSPSGVLDTTIGASGIVVVQVNNGYDYCNSVAVDNGNAIIIGGSGNILGGSEAIMAKFRSGVPATVKNISALKKLDLYPNPVTKNATLAYTLNNAGNVAIALYDMTGKMVQLIQPLRATTAGAHNVTVTLQDALPTGNYIISVTGDGGECGYVKIQKQ